MKKRHGRTDKQTRSLIAWDCPDQYPSIIPYMAQNSIAKIWKEKWSKAFSIYPIVKMYLHTYDDDDYNGVTHPTWTIVCDLKYSKIVLLNFPRNPMFNVSSRISVMLILWVSLTRITTKGGWKKVIKFGWWWWWLLPVWCGQEQLNSLSSLKLHSKITKMIQNNSAPKQNLIKIR